MKRHCLNKACKKRESCKHSDDVTENDKKINTFFAHEENCQDYECMHKVWRRYISEDHKECDNCHEIAPLFDAPEIQHQR
jgi:hypothetical protein